MKLDIFVFVYCVLSFSCKFRGENHHKSNDSLGKDQEQIHPIVRKKTLQERVIGNWVEHKDGNDTVIIKMDSIFSFAWISGARYSIDSNIISIGNGAYYNRFLLSLRHDTLVFTDQDGNTRKYTRLGK